MSVWHRQRVEDSATSATRRPDSLPRYAPEQLPNDACGHASWGIRDTRTGKLAQNSGETVRFPWLGGAEGWVRRQNELDSAWP